MKRRDARCDGGSLVLLLGAHQIARGASIVAVRVWPAPDYTRVTIESDGLLPARSFLAERPAALALDIDGLELDPALRDLVAKVQAGRSLHRRRPRRRRTQPRVVRLVIDLKQAAVPQVFKLRAGRGLPAPAGGRPLSGQGGRPAGGPDRDKEQAEQGRAGGAGRARRVHRPLARRAATRLGD